MVSVMERLERIVSSDCRNDNVDLLYMALECYCDKFCCGDLLECFMNPFSYKLFRENIHDLCVPLVSFDVVTDNLKDLLLVDGSLNHCLDEYCDWESCTNDEIEAYYVNVNGGYVRDDMMEELVDKCKVLNGKVDELVDDSISDFFSDLKVKFNVTVNVNDMNWSYG